MLGMLACTQEQELVCGEVHELMDQFAEMKIRGEDPSDRMPLVQQHLDMWPDCRDEYEALIKSKQALKKVPVSSSSGGRT